MPLVSYMMNTKNNEDMSMEEILASIRDYVRTKPETKPMEGEEDITQKTPDLKPQIFHLRPTAEEAPTRSPFEEIREIKRRKENGVFDCLKMIVFEWLETHPEFVEKAIAKAIEKELDI